MFDYKLKRLSKLPTLRRNIQIAIEFAEGKTAAKIASFYNITIKRVLDIHIEYVRYAVRNSISRGDTTYSDIPSLEVGKYRNIKIVRILQNFKLYFDERVI